MSSSFALPQHDATTVIAVGRGGGRSCGQLAADVAAATAALPAAAGPGATVLLAADDRYHFAVGLLAVWARGATLVLPPSHRPEVLQAIAREAAVVAWVHDGAGGSLDLRDFEGQASAPTLPALGLEGVVARLFTSGSTGSPSAIDKHAHQLLGEVELLERVLEGRLPRTLVATAPPRHIYGLLFSVLLPLRTGAAFVRETPLHRDAILQAVRNHGADTLVGVPAHLQSLQGLQSLDCPSLEHVISSAGPLPQGSWDALTQALKLQVIEIFGSTETGGIGSRRAFGEPWQPFPGLRVEASEDDELLLHSPLLARGIATPYRTADRIELLPGGRFRHRGRSDDVLKIGGTRVSLNELEEHTRALPGVQDAAALAVKVDGPRQHEIWMAVAAPELTVVKLRSELQRFFDPVVLPRRFRIVESLPREATGKLSGARLRTLFGSEAPDAPVDRQLRPERVEQRRQGALDVAELDFQLMPELVYFRGHFDGHPLLPGVVQVEQLVLAQAKRLWPQLGRLRTVQQLKFRHPLVPGARPRVSLERDAQTSRVRFAIHADDTLCASGALIFSAGDAP
ncbi:MAG: AMP-binding protein [Myxococcales bacterium]|nr:AMP-binding protein [Myxococcales bacterium]